MKIHRHKVKLMKLSLQCDVKVASNATRRMKTKKIVDQWNQWKIPLSYPSPVAQLISAASRKFMNVSGGKDMQSVPVVQLFDYSVKQRLLWLVDKTRLLDWRQGLRATKLLDLRNEYVQQRSVPNGSTHVPLVLERQLLRNKVGVLLDIFAGL